MSIEPAFVGEGRHAVVAGLLEAFDRIRAGGPATWIMLEAPSGWGKTRVLQELYRRLAAERQDAPGYWPPDILSTLTAAPSDVGGRRKRLVPEVTHTPDTLPGYLWWGISCSLRGGVASASLRHDLAQVHAHADYLEDAWREVTARRRRWTGGLRDAGYAAADEAAMEVAGTALESALGAAVPGLGLVRWLGERGVASARAAAARRDRLRSSERLEASDLVSETAAMLGRLAVPDLPLVVAVEDLHAADAGLADLLAALVSGPASVLVVSSSWPGLTQDNEHVRRAMDAAAGRFVRLDHRSTAAPDPFGPDASLTQLGPEALAAIVRHHHPGVDGETLAAIVQRYPNPLTVELFCGLPRVRRRGRDGALTLDPATVAAAPAEIRGLYTELWNELPEPVRESLSLAVLGIPALVDPRTATEWNTDLVLDALRELDWPSLEDLAHALRSGGDAYSWARSVSASLRTFNEPDQRDIAAADDSFLFDEDRAEVRTAIAAALGRHVAGSAGDVDPVERLHLADLAVVLHAEGFLTDADVLADAVRHAAELTFDDQRDLPRAAELLTRAIEAGPSPDRRIRAHLMRGHVQLMAGRLHDALGDLEEVAAADGPELLQIEVLNLRARVLTALRRDAEAVEAYRSLVDELAGVRGVDHPDALGAGAGLALALSRAGQVDEALEVVRDVAQRAEHLLGPDDPVTLSVRNGLAVQLGERGWLEEAHSLLLELEEGCRRRLGPGHPRSLAVRRNAAWIAFTLGRDGVGSMLRELVADHQSVLGAEHPDTFTARRLLGMVLAATGGEDEAQEGADLLTAMHAREVEVLGWDHPDVQATRRVVADLALASGDHGLATRILERYVQDCERVFGSGALAVHDGRARLGRALAISDRGAEAVVQLESAVEGFIGLVGDRSEQVLATRQLLGRTYASLGDLARAGEELEAVVVIARERWGAADLRTFDARDDLARLAHVRGRTADALAQWRQLAVDSAASLGPHHELTEQLLRLVDEVAGELDASRPPEP